MGFDDFWGAMISINISPLTGFRHLHTPIVVICTGRFQILINPEVSGWNIYSQ